jgi:hypothetical protein
MIKIEAAQRLQATNRKHSPMEKKYESIVQDALDDADIAAEPGINFPEPTLTLDPNSSLKDVLTTLRKALGMQPKHSKDMDVFTNDIIAVIVYSKQGKPSRLVVSEQSED